LVSSESNHSDADESRVRFRTRAFVAVTVGCYVLVLCLEELSLIKYAPAVIFISFLAALWFARDLPGFLWRIFKRASHARTLGSSTTCEYVGECDKCSSNFSCVLIHNGFNDTAYGYCDKCGTTAFVSAWRSDIPPSANFKAHGPISPETEALAAPCKCGGRFRCNSAPCCPSCGEKLSADAAAAWLEQQAPGAKMGWRWQRSWSGLYALVVSGKATQLEWESADINSNK
jgi:hypothetical protein